MTTTMTTPALGAAACSLFGRADPVRRFLNRVQQLHVPMARSNDDSIPASFPVERALDGDAAEEAFLLFFSVGCGNLRSASAEHLATACEGARSPVLMQRSTRASFPPYSQQRALCACL